MSTLSAATSRPPAKKTATDLCKAFALGDEAAPLLKPELTPRQFLDLLREKKLTLDAIRLLAHDLPKRDAVWWACQCARLVAADPPPPKAIAALDAAEKWCKDPNEGTRRATQPAAEAAALGTPAGCAALAAFFSGGSLGPPNVAPIPPGEFLTAKAASGAVLLAGVLSEPEKAADKYDQFLALGLEIAGGKRPWK
jgi:hypothetical protein